MIIALPALAGGAGCTFDCGDNSFAAPTDGGLMRQRDLTVASRVMAKTVAAMVSSAATCAPCAADCQTQACPLSATCASFGAPLGSQCLVPCSPERPSDDAPWLGCEAPGNGGDHGFSISGPADPAGFCGPAFCDDDPSSCGPDGACVASYCEAR